MRRAAAVALLGAAACVTPRPPFVPTEASFVAARAGFEVVPPPGWMRFAAAEDALVVTRDGTPLQRIVVAASPIVPGKSDPRLAPGMSLEDFADFIVADLRTAAKVSNVRATVQAPALLSGKPGFRVIVAYDDARGMARLLAAYGLVEDARLYKLYLEAPARLYFDRALPVLDELARTFRLRAPAAAAP